MHTTCIYSIISRCSQGCTGVRWICWDLEYGTVPASGVCVQAHPGQVVASLANASLANSRPAEQYCDYAFSASTLFHTLAGR